MEILDRYIHQLLDQSTPESPIWYKEESDASAPAKWNYMDGCMIKAILELYHITQNSRYLEFADHFIDHFVREDGSIVSYDPEEYNPVSYTHLDVYKRQGPAPEAS